MQASATARHVCTGRHRQTFWGRADEQFTSSSLVCWLGKENVNPTGSFLSLMLRFSMKSPRHSATWSNSWNRSEKLSHVQLSGLVGFCINLLWFRCREWYPPVCRRFDSPSGRSASSRGWLWHGGSGSCCLPDPKQWSLPFLSNGDGRKSRGRYESLSFRLAEQIKRCRAWHNHQV